MNFSHTRTSAMFKCVSVSAGVSQSLVFQSIRNFLLP